MSFQTSEISPDFRQTAGKAMADRMSFTENGETRYSHPPEVTPAALM
jgi:hypothetical protein